MVDRPTLKAGADTGAPKAVAAGRQVFPRGKSADDYRTPPALFDSIAEEIGGFDLDAAANEENALCPDYLDREADALGCDWFGRVWLNPPYSEVDAWLEKVVQEVTAGRVSVCWVLLRVATGSMCFHRWVIPHAVEVRLIDGRLAFAGPNSDAGASGTFDSMLVRFGGEAPFALIPPRFLAADRLGRINTVTRTTEHDRRNAPPSVTLADWGGG